MPATELTCDSDIELVRALRSVGVLSGLREDDPGDTPGPQQTAPASRRDTPDVRHAASAPRRDTPAGRSGRPRDTPVAPLRLTRRGRVVVTLAAALLVTMVSLLLAGVAQATNHGPSPRAARQNLVQVVVRPGQTLWSVAESADPDQDTRVVVRQIVDLNSLSGPTVQAGQQLWVPRG
ncbi:MAG TPA: LysM peptidoglycan-binding domain-containing protein [Streptosporangiaceae bacterium]|nr:LysM peptidoglycan-binding domain-containing protein [Streptosporangiaceae bacterium]